MSKEFSCLCATLQASHGTWSRCLWYVAISHADWDQGCLFPDLNKLSEGFVVFFLTPTILLHILTMFYNPSLDTLPLEGISYCLPYLWDLLRSVSVLLLISYSGRCYRTEKKIYQDSRRNKEKSTFSLYFRSYFVNDFVFKIFSSEILLVFKFLEWLVLIALGYSSHTIQLFYLKSNSMLLI